MNLQELQVIKKSGVGIKIIVLNNHCYGITVAYQRTNFEGRTEACVPDKGYEPPDFVRIAAAYGISTMSCEYTSMMDRDIEMLLTHNGPLVCDVNIDRFATYEPRVVGWSTPIEDMTPLLSDEEFYSNMIIPALERGS